MHSSSGSADETADMDADSARVATLIEQLRLIDAQLIRRRHSATGFHDTDRSAIRLILEETRRGREVTPSFIATSLRITPPAVTVVLDRLTAAGVVRVVAHPSDRRKKMVVALDPGADPDEVDPLTSRLRALAAALPAEDAAVISAFLTDVLAAVTDAYGHPA